ncbi:MAG: extracellular solute-binding protein [Clostridia bacterium]|nr:extracellular solute-binding protein [Clostridia bacterium]
MKNFKRLLCLSLCALMLLSVLVACNQDNTDSTDSESESNEVTDVVETTDTEKVYETDENGYVMDDLPDTTYNGEKVRVLGWKGSERYTLPEDSGGGNVQLYSKIYFNKLSVEARLDIQLDVTYIAATGNDPGAVVRNAFVTEVKSGAGDYDLIQTYSLYPAVLAQQGLLVNINNLKYPNLEMPWWPDAISEWEQYDGLYFVANNSSALAIRSMFVMFSYTEMIVGSGLKDPVELVLEGKWTVEKMMEYAKNFHGDAIAKPGEVYGFVVDDHSRTDALYYGAGFHQTLNNDKGVAEMTWNDASYRTRVIDYLDPLITFFKLEEVEIADNTASLMYNKKTALMLASMGNVDGLTDNSYAPIPIPKIDEEGEYCTMQNNGYDMWCIPKTTDNAELSGVVLEAIASSEYRNVAPFYYDTVLKDRYSQDANGVKVFEILRDAVVYDFGRLCQFTMTNPIEYIWRRNFVTGKVKDPKNILENQWATYGGATQNELMELLADFRNNNRAQ